MRHIAVLRLQTKTRTCVVIDIDIDLQAMDVRCEKCQTEYELDESRLKPGGVTVKCTNCGHMFKIRKRTITNVGTPPIATGAPPIPRDGNEITRRRANSSKQPLGGGLPGAGGAVGKSRGDSLFEDDARQLADDAPTTVDRQWLIRLENGEQKSCRELATLQQWIISSVVTRESLISRTGKTWKRLGDIADLSQYFTIADEARANRERNRPASRPAPPAPIKEVPGTVPGYSAAAIAGHGTAPQAAGGTILPDDDDDLPEARTTRRMPILRAMGPRARGHELPLPGLPPHARDEPRDDHAVELSEQLGLADPRIRHGGQRLHVPRESGYRHRCEPLALA